MPSQKTWTITKQDNELRKKRISKNNAKHWLGKKRPDMAKKHTGKNNPMYGKTVSEETRLKMSQAHQKRLKNHKYKDPLKSKSAYIDIHKWVQKHKGKPNFCEHCLTNEDRMYHWANVSGEYLRDLDDWIRLCVPCHFKFDGRTS